MTHTRSWYPTFRLRRGYTVVELLIVTTIAGVISVLSMGHISTYARERAVAAASAAVQNDLQQAFAIAARNRRPVRVWFAPADTALRITSRDSTVTYLRRGLGLGSGFMLEPSDVTFCASSCSAARIDVFPNGWASDTVSVTLRKGSYSRTVRMSRSGLISTR
jgi:prepilin-type N-terminal cleavage/methylation domain-containing protein